MIIEASIKEISNGWLLRYNNYNDFMVETFYETNLEAIAGLMFELNKTRQEIINGDK